MYYKAMRKIGQKYQSSILFPPITYPLNQVVRPIMGPAMAFDTLEHCLKWAIRTGFGWPDAIIVCDGELSKHQPTMIASLGVPSLDHQRCQAFWGGTLSDNELMTVPEGTVFLDTVLVIGPA